MERAHRHASVERVLAHLDTSLVASWTDLCETFGASAVRVSKRLREVVAVLPGIYASAPSASNFLVRAKAVSLRSAPSGRITGLAAAHLWRVIDEAPTRITVQVGRSMRLHVPQWVRVLRVPYSGRTFRVRDIRTVAVPDAVVQSWREARQDVGAATVIASIMRRKTSASDLLDALARRKQIPRRGQLSELIGLVENTVTSYLEYVAWRDVFPPRLFPDLRWQVVIWPNGRKRVMDAFDAEAKIDLEFDGGSTHGGVDGFERDRQRDADMRAEGIEPLHFTYRDLTQRPEWCRQTYLTLREARLRQPWATRTGSLASHP